MQRWAYLRPRSSVSSAEESSAVRNGCAQLNHAKAITQPGQSRNVSLHYYETPTPAEKLDDLLPYLNYMEAEK